KRVANDLQRLPINAQHFDDGITHSETGNDRGQEDTATRRREEIEIEDGVLCCRFRHDWRHALNELVQRIDWNFWRGNSVEERFYLRQPPDEDDDAENDPGQPGTKECGFRIAGCGLQLYLARFVLWFIVM